MTQSWKGEFITLILVSYLIVSIHSAPLSAYLVSSFTPPDPDPNLPFNHIAFNNITGDIYIGARERLYQLDSDLNLKETVDTGECSHPNKDHVNDNKLLISLVTPQNYRLIACGGCDGDCQTSSLDNITLDQKSVSTTNKVVSTGDRPTVGAIVLGADNENTGEGKIDGDYFLFNGISGGAPRDTYFISKRRLIDHVSLQEVPGIAVVLPSEKNNLVFQHLISYKDYLYYFISRGEITYLGRLCRNTLDDNFESYTEIELQCTRGGSQNIIQSAYIGPAGSQLAESMNVNTTDDLLYAVFSSTSSSSLCVYKMIDVQQSFDDAILKCINGTGNKNSFLVGSMCNTHECIE
ncbi:plexin-A4-like [Lytechinus pictus]|uniref:plexin-A4-like n=1 Tax=Lytechinus pictus TaxID=7653 RepID=UPI0030B9CA05